MALDWQRSDMDRDLYAIRPADGGRLQRFGVYDLKAENRSALVGVDWHVTEQLSLVGDLKYTQAVRDARERNAGKTLDQDWNYAAAAEASSGNPRRRSAGYRQRQPQQRGAHLLEIVNGEVPAPAEPRQRRAPP